MRICSRPRRVSFFPDLSTSVCRLPNFTFVFCASRGSVLARLPLGEYAAARYGAPYWVTHRGDLQAALLDAVRASPDIVLKLGTRVEDFVVHGNGISVGCRHGAESADDRNRGGSKLLPDRQVAIALRFWWFVGFTIAAIA